MQRAIAGCTSGRFIIVSKIGASALQELSGMFRTRWPRISLLCSRSSEKARLSAGWGETAVGKRRHGCARLGVERETTVDQTLIRGLVTAFRVFVSGLSSV